MTATAAARAAVDPRPARGTTGRRAVQVVLFLGGLLALGLLAGGRAEAQERPEPGGLTASVAGAVPEDAVRESTVGEGAVSEDLARTPVEPPVRRVADEVMDPVADEADQVVDPVVEPVADRAAQHRPTQHLSVQGRPTPHRPAQPETARKATAALSASAEPATEPVASVTPVVGGAGDAVDRIAGEVRPLVASLPGLPPLLSVLPELPVPGGDPDAPGAPAAPVPGTGRGAEGSTTPGGTGADASAEHAAGQGRSAGAPGLAPTVPERSGTPDAGHAQLSAPTPALPPTRDRAPFAPCGNLVRTVVADAQGPRGGDLHAAPVPGGPYAALVRGAGLPATAAPITDRSGEILEFPG